MADQLKGAPRFHLMKSRGPINMEARMAATADYLGVAQSELAMVPATRLYKVRNFGRRSFEYLVTKLQAQGVTPSWPTSWYAFKRAAHTS